MSAIVRPGSQLDRFCDLVRAHAEAGQPLPTQEQLAELLGVPGQRRVSDLMEHAERRGLMVIVRGRLGIKQISAPDGSWTVTGAMYATRSAGDRRCLRCRLMFKPQHRGNFLCRGCGFYADRVG